MENNNVLYNRLTECLQDCKSSIHDKKNPLVECINKCLQRLNEPIQLAIIGKISSSKSTLVNAILGRTNVVATGQSELTYNVNWLTYGNEQTDIEIFLSERPMSCGQNESDDLSATSDGVVFETLWPIIRANL